MSGLPDENGMGAQPVHRDGTATNASAADSSGSVLYPGARVAAP